MSRLITVQITQFEFLCLPIETRRRILKQQADALCGHCMGTGVVEGVESGEIESECQHCEGTGRHKEGGKAE